MNTGDDVKPCPVSPTETLKDAGSLPRPPKASESLPEQHKTGLDARYQGEYGPARRELSPHTDRTRHRASTAHGEAPDGPPARVDGVGHHHGPDSGVIPVTIGLFGQVESGARKTFFGRPRDERNSLTPDSTDFFRPFPYREIFEVHAGRKTRRHQTPKVAAQSTTRGHTKNPLNARGRKQNGTQSHPVTRPWRSSKP